MRVEPLGQACHLRVAELNDHPLPIGASRDVHGEKAGSWCHIHEDIGRGLFIVILAFCPVLDSEQGTTVEEEDPKFLCEGHAALGVRREWLELDELAKMSPPAR